MQADELRKLPLLEKASAETLDLLAERGVETRWTAGSTIWTEGSPARGLFVLLEGSVRVVRSRDGREFVIHRASPGSTLGEIPLFDGGGYPATLVSDTDVRFLVIDRPLLEHAITRDPSLAWALLGFLGGRVRDLAARLAAITTDSVNTRLMRHLLERYDRNPGREFTLGMTQAALARELGTVRETVARGLSVLVGEGFLERRGRARYHLIDADRFRDRATAARSSSSNSPPG